MTTNPMLTGPEYEVVLGVFKRIARKAWFRNDVATLNKFGRSVINAYQSGITDPEELHDHCLLVAKVLLPEQR